MNDQLILVLDRPRDVRNIGAVVRAMANFGFGRLRLVEPVPFDPADLLGIAHRADSIVAAIETFESLQGALADTRYVVGTSERSHPERPMRADLRPLAAELVGRSAAGPVALLFGSEQTGLSNAAFDRCDIVLSLPTDPGYPSLNLAQAALLLLYELRQAAAAGGMPDRASRARVVSGELDALCASVASALRAIRFVKSGDGTAVLRRLRALIQRAEPDTAEVALLAAIAREVTKVGERSEI